ncbi:MAG TPA: YkgJ family cysteine cluster protein [Planctomycetes bacterium]|nr:YkgJ family cysteine cluster protein [Planctomycetota bacterium]
MIDGNSMPWYVGGLHFECVQCGGCCAGPNEGYIWVAKAEIRIIADFLKMTPGELRSKFLKRVGLRSTIIEHPNTKDCIFLQGTGSQKTCTIYPVRPSQCRSWPFWPGNLAGPDSWNKVAQKCPGINRGKHYSYEEIEKIKSEKKWWQDTEQ